MIKLELSVMPPSVNSLWVNKPSGRYKSKRGKIFENLAGELEKNESEILKQIREKDGASVEFGGYYLLDEARANEVMRPSKILNQIIG